MMDDAELLRRYARDRDENAFAELVRRHVNLVHSAALRQVNGDAYLAADATQIVFTDLARKAANLARHRVLAGWLFTSTRYAAANLVRAERRRRRREEEAHDMQASNHDSSASIDWDRVRPLLDEALAKLAEGDRLAILLRFFERQDYAAIGARLNLGDNAARMRVERALDKLQALLSRRGVSSSAAALAAVLGEQAVLAAPAGMAASVAGVALLGGAAGAGAMGATAAAFMSITKWQAGLTAALVAAGTAGWWVQAESNAALRRELALVARDEEAQATARAENLRLGRELADTEALRQSVQPLAELRGKAAQARASAPPARPPRVLELKELDASPRLRVPARPVYPEELRTAGIGGDVQVSFVVGPDGAVQQAQVVTISLTGERVEEREGKSMIDGREAEKSARAFELAAVEAVRQWRFDPGRLRGEAVGTRMVVPIVFAIDREDGHALAPKSIEVPRTWF